MMTMNSIVLTAVEAMECSGCPWKIEPGDRFVSIDHRQAGADGEDLSHRDNICMGCEVKRTRKGEADDPTDPSPDASGDPEPVEGPTS